MSTYTILAAELFAQQVINGTAGDAIVRLMNGEK